MRKNMKKIVEKWEKAGYRPAVQLVVSSSLIDVHMDVCNVLNKKATWYVYCLVLVVNRF